jgi:hypothetical protein
MIPAVTNGSTFGGGDYKSQPSQKMSDSEDSDSDEFYPYELRPLPTQVSLLQ